MKSRWFKFDGKLYLHSCRYMLDREHEEKDWQATNAALEAAMAGDIEKAKQILLARQAAYLKREQAFKNRSEAQTRNRY